MRDNNRIAVVNQLWLEYFNQVLFDKGIITESERNKMINLISTRKTILKPQNQSILT